MCSRRRDTLQPQYRRAVIMHTSRHVTTTHTHGFKWFKGSNVASKWQPSLGPARAPTPPIHRSSLHAPAQLLAPLRSLHCQPAPAPAPSPASAPAPTPACSCHCSSAPPLLAPLHSLHCPPAPTPAHSHASAPAPTPATRATLPAPPPTPAHLTLPYLPSSRLRVVRFCLLSDHPSPPPLPYRPQYCFCFPAPVVDAVLWNRRRNKNGRWDEG